MAGGERKESANYDLFCFPGKLMGNYLEMSGVSVPHRLGKSVRSAQRCPRGDRHRGTAKVASSAQVLQQQ